MCVVVQVEMEWLTSGHVILTVPWELEARPSLLQSKNHEVGRSLNSYRVQPPTRGRNRNQTISARWLSKFLSIPLPYHFMRFCLIFNWNLTSCNGLYWLPTNCTCCQVHLANIQECFREGMKHNEIASKLWMKAGYLRHVDPNHQVMPPIIKWVEILF